MQKINPFQIIKPTDLPSEKVGKDVMESTETVVLILRFVQLFVGDYNRSIFELFKTESITNPKNNKKI